MAAASGTEDQIDVSSRDGAIRRVIDQFDSGVFLDDLARRIAVASESQNPARRAVLE